MIALWLLLAPSAEAYDPDSLRAEASFGLFRDEYDFLREPAMLAEQPGRHLFTVLGNQGGAERLSFGYLGATGPGVLGVIADGTTEGASEATATTRAATADTGEQITTVASDRRVLEGGLFAGYGLALSDGFALGLGVELEASRWATSLAPSLDGGVEIGGSLTTVTEEGEVIWREDGRYVATSTSWTAIVGAAVEAGSADVEIDLHLERRRTEAVGEAALTSPVQGASIEGLVPGASPVDNVAVWMPGAVVDATVALGDRTALRLFVEAGAGPGAPTATRREVSVYELETHTSSLTVHSDPNVLLADGEVLAALHVDDEGPVAVRFGLSAAVEYHRIALTATTTDQDGATRTERLATTDRYLALAAPIAVEVRASERVTLRAGGRYVHAFIGLDSANTLRTAPGEGEIVQVAQRSRSERSSVELALGVRTSVADRFSLDVVTTGVGTSDNQRVGLDLGTLLLSGVFHL